jgi:hypothetical protein
LIGGEQPEQHEPDAEVHRGGEMIPIHVVVDRFVAGVLNGEAAYMITNTPPIR